MTFIVDKWVFLHPGREPASMLVKKKKVIPQQMKCVLVIKYVRTIYK